MVESKPSGTVYSRRRGAGFTRGHRASRRGERPSPDTMNLVNSVVSQKTGELSAKTEVTADYGEILQKKLNRPVMSETDVKEAEKSFEQKTNKALISLL